MQSLIQICLVEQMIKILGKDVRFIVKCPFEYVTLNVTFDLLFKNFNTSLLKFNLQS